MIKINNNVKEKNKQYIAVLLSNGDMILANDVCCTIFNNSMSLFDTFPIINYDIDFSKEWWNKFISIKYSCDEENIEKYLTKEDFTIDVTINIK